MCEKREFVRPQRFRPGWFYCRGKDRPPSGEITPGHLFDPKTILFPPGITKKCVYGNNIVARDMPRARKCPGCCKPHTKPEDHVLCSRLRQLPDLLPLFSFLSYPAVTPMFPVGVPPAFPLLPTSFASLMVLSSGTTTVVGAAGVHLVTRS